MQPAPMSRKRSRWIFLIVAALALGSMSAAWSVEPVYAAVAPSAGLGPDRQAGEPDASGGDDLLDALLQQDVFKLSVGVGALVLAAALLVAIAPGIRRLRARRVAATRARQTRSAAARIIEELREAEPLIEPEEAAEAPEAQPRESSPDPRSRFKTDVVKVDVAPESVEVAELSRAPDSAESDETLIGEAQPAEADTIGEAQPDAPPVESVSAEEAPAAPPEAAERPKDSLLSSLFEEEVGIDPNFQALADSLPDIDLHSLLAMEAEIDGHLSSTNLLTPTLEAATAERLER